MKRTWCRRLIVLILLLLAIGWVAGQYDYGRMVSGKRPVFARVRLSLNDGGSVQYLGLGYTITDKHEMRWGIEMKPEVMMSPEWKAAPYAPFRIGPTLDYWTPFISRENTRFIVETNK